METKSEKVLNIGTRVIKAEPMTRLEYNQFRGWELPADENGSDAGFKVVDTSSNHTSWLPSKEFNSIYSEASNMTFGSAIEAMKLGNKVARKGWNGKGMYVYLIKGKELKSTTNETVIGDPFITMKTATGSHKPGWLASQADMLSEDWEIIE